MAGAHRQVLRHAQHEQRQDQVRHPVGEVGGLQDAHRQRAEDQRQPVFQPGARPRLPGDQHLVDQPADHQQRQRHGDGVGVRVAVEKREVRDFRDRVAGVGHDPRRIPVPPVRAEIERLAAQQAPDATGDRAQWWQELLAGDRPPAARARQGGDDQADVVQIAQHHRQQHGRPARHPGIAPQRTGPAVLLAPPAPHQVEGGRERGHPGQGEQRRQDQVEGHRRQQTQQLDRRPHQHEAVIVVVDVPAGEPGVDRREECAAQHAVEVGEVHRPLAAEVGMPQVGVAQPHAQEGQEQQQPQPFQDQHLPPVRPHIGAQRRPPPPAQRRAGDQHQQQRQQQPAPRPRRQAQAGPQPRQP